VQAAALRGHASLLLLAAVVTTISVAAGYFVMRGAGAR